MKHGYLAIVNQITTISKQRVFVGIYNVLAGIRLSSESLNKLDASIDRLFKYSRR